MQTERAGLLFGVAAYLLWGLFPIYWPLLEPSSAIEILAHRVVWSLVAIGVLTVVTRRWSRVRVLLRDRRRTGLLAVAAVVVAINWGTYIWGVNHEHVVETSLGYFINPLVTVLFGVVLLREQLRRVQWAALALGAVAVLVLAVDYGRPPWIALTLAFSFGTYGLIKKHVSVGAVESLLVETSVLAPVAFGYLVVLGAQGDSTFGSAGVGHLLLLLTTGVVTAAPLLCFSAAATRLPLTTIGLLQYLAPVLQFAFGVLLLHEPMPTTRLIGFALVWAALVILSVDGMRAGRATVRRRAALDAAASEAY